MYIMPSAVSNTIYEARCIQKTSYLYSLDASIRFYYTYKGMRHAHLLDARTHPEYRVKFTNRAITAHRNAMFHLQSIRREIQEHKCQLKRLQMMN